MVKSTQLQLFCAPTNKDYSVFVESIDGETARAGESDRAQTMADELSRQARLSTALNNFWLPTIRATIELNRKHPSKALESLQPALDYELGVPFPQAQVCGSLYSAYVRREAYLRAGQGQQAAAEFQKLIEHRGIVMNFILGALAHRQLARAKAMSGDQENARKSYQDFFALWKEADPDVPIVRQASAEYEKLRP
jgi:eukaryotic-like serine/threonine-protein kinase